ncbi:MAG: hypothetical protein AB7V50_07075 [Vampirovibrionia bacterium]
MENIEYFAANMLFVIGSFILLTVFIGFIGVIDASTDSITNSPAVISAFSG